MGLERRKKEDLSAKASKNIGWEEALELILKENNKELKTGVVIDNSGPLEEFKTNVTPNDDEKGRNMTHSK
jgi:hypothetical protein